MIPKAVRERDLVGYGRTPPQFEWPDDARVVVNLVLVYEEGSEYSVRWGDDRKRTSFMAGSSWARRCSEIKNLGRE